MEENVGIACHMTTVEKKKKKEPKKPPSSPTIKKHKFLKKMNCACFEVGLARSIHNLVLRKTRTSLLELS